MQSVPLAVLKPETSKCPLLNFLLHAIRTACGIETHEMRRSLSTVSVLHAIRTACGIETAPFYVLIEEHVIACNPYRLRYWNATSTVFCPMSINCMQSVPLAVLKLRHPDALLLWPKLHAIRTACGIETFSWFSWTSLPSIACNPYRLRYWNNKDGNDFDWILHIACNPYRLRYWNANRENHSRRIASLHAIRTACGIETLRKRLPIAKRQKIQSKPNPLRY